MYKALMAGEHRRSIGRQADGSRVGGTPISLTSLHHLLQNPAYIGEVTHRGERFPGLSRADRLQYRQRRETSLPVSPCNEPSCPDEQLTAFMDHVCKAQGLLYRHRDLSVAEPAWSVGKKPLHFSRLIRLNYLAPDIIAAIVDGRRQLDLLARC
ncbi:hypothetical protein GCM10022211_14120 [Sphingomonas humi]|uniref:Recombinase domain-containing protein n=1 Tax=Sphingomonas humi TaxID=335630 RepID=A0ABP7RXB4_9SPHN